MTDNGTPNLSATQAFLVTLYLPPTISVQVNGAQMQLSWPRGTLQEADEIDGPYVDVTATSPLSVDLSESRKFFRISRSTIVNVDRIKELQPMFHGEYAVILRNGTRLTLSRGYREKLDQLLGK